MIAIIKIFIEIVFYMCVIVTGFYLYYLHTEEYEDTMLCIRKIEKHNKRDQKRMLRNERKMVKNEKNSI